MSERVDTVIMIDRRGWWASYRCGTGRLVHILELDCEDIAPVVLVEQLLHCDLWLGRDMGQDEVGVPGFVLELVRFNENAITDMNGRENYIRGIAGKLVLGVRDLIILKVEALK